MNISFSLKKIHLLFLTILSIFNIIQAITLPLIDDEAYYWMWSKKLDLGYFDHPPMIALFVKLGYYIVPSVLGVRLLSIISYIFTYFIWLKILTPKNKKEDILFIGLLGSVGIFQAMGFISTPDVPLFLFGSFFLWRWKAFLKNQNLSNSLLLGLSISCTLYSKYHGFLLIFLCFLPCIIFLYKNKWFYISIIFAFILYLPHIYWLYQHDWITIKYHLFERSRKKTFKIFWGEWFTGLLLIGNPFLFYFYTKAIIKKVNNRWILSLQSLVLGGLIFFSFFAFGRRMQPQWNLFIYLGIIPLTYLAYRRKKEKWIVKLSFLYIGLIFIVRFLLFFPYFIKLTPMYKLKEYINSVNAVNKGIAVFERYQKASLYNFYTKKPSECLQVYTFRKSQYDLWNSENNIQGKKTTFFGIGFHSENSILDEQKQEVNYKTIDKFYSYPKIFCTKVSPFGYYEYEHSIDKIKLDIIWNNPYDKEITLAPNSNLEAGIILVDPKSFKLKSYVPILNSIKIPAKSSIKNSCYIPNVNTNDYKCYIIIQAYGLPGKIISNEIEFK